MKNIHDHIDHVISKIKMDPDIYQTEGKITIFKRTLYYLEKLEMHNAMSPLIHIRSTAHPNG